MIFEKISMLLLLNDSIKSHITAFSRIPFETENGWAAQESPFCFLISSNVSSNVRPGLISLVIPYAIMCPLLSIVTSSAGYTLID